MKNSDWLQLTFWRWHFYAAIFITPLLITLSLSGIAYLFKEPIEDGLYKSMYFGTSGQTQAISRSQAITEIEQSFPGYKVTKLSYFDEESKRNLRVSIFNNATGNEKYVYLDPTNHSVGSLNADDHYANVTRNLHSSLLVGGTVVNHLVELAACWTVFLVVTGLYMSWRQKRQASATVTARQRVKWRHTVVGVIFAVPILLLVFSGLPWSAYMGKEIGQIARSHYSLGYPALYVNPPKSDKEDLPWGTRDENPPTTEIGGTALTIEKMEALVREQYIRPPFVMKLPSDAAGVYTISKSSSSGITGMNVSPSEVITAYFDQYNGKLISKIDYHDYGILAKWVTYGIPLHEGHLFGWPNLLLCLLTVLSLLVLIFWGFRMWLLRKPKGKWTAPPKQRVGSGAIPFIIIMLIMGILMPLFGISLVAIAILEMVLYIYRTRHIGVAP